MSPTHLVLKETCEQQALRPGGLQHGAVTLEGGVQDEVVKHGPEGFGGGHLAVSLRRHLGVVRQHAGVVEQLLAVNRPFGYVWVANYYSARNPLRLSSLVILGVVARMFRCATRSSCWCT